MIRVKIFDNYCADNEIEKFILEHDITREQIISISFAVDANAHLGRLGAQQILLAWENNK